MAGPTKIPGHATPIKEHPTFRTPFCYVAPINAIRRKPIDRDPDTGEKLPFRTTNIRLAYAKAHEITLHDLTGYQVFPNRTLCGSPVCANPKHWRVAANPSRDKTAPRIPWWLEDGWYDADETPRGT